MVKIREFYDKKEEDKLPFNVIEDLAIYMRNDPMFYRKTFFPAVIEMKKCTEKKEQYNPNNLSPVIEKAIVEYCKKFNLPKRPEELLDDIEKKELVKKLYAEEMTQIRKGAY